MCDSFYRRPPQMLLRRGLPAHKGDRRRPFRLANADGSQTACTTRNEFVVGSKTASYRLYPVDFFREFVAVRRPKKLETFRSVAVSADNDDSLAPVVQYHLASRPDTVLMREAPRPARRVVSLENFYGAGPACNEMTAPPDGVKSVDDHLATIN